MTDLRPPTPHPFEPVSCVDCVFATPRILDADESGPTPVALDCRRFPPTLVGDIDMDGNMALTQAWPQMAEGDWCGEGVRPDEPEEADDE